MDTRTDTWTAHQMAGSGSHAVEGLRERKKRMLRQQLSDTATRIFLERGFDAVRVSEIAEACGVSEKTVFNYFPTKESLILDRFDGAMAALRTALSEPTRSPVEAILQMLHAELGGMTSMLAAQDDPAEAAASFVRFGILIESTLSLRLHLRERLDQLIAVAAEIIAGRIGMSPDDPEPRIAANALLGLWQIQLRSLTKYVDGARTPAQVSELVAAEVHRAARLLDAGLSSLAGVAPAVGGQLEGQAAHTC